MVAVPLVLWRSLLLFLGAGTQESVIRSCMHVGHAEINKYSAGASNPHCSCDARRNFRGAMTWVLTADHWITGLLDISVAFCFETSEGMHVPEQLNNP